MRPRCNILNLFYQNILEYVKHERDIAMEIEPCDIIVIAAGDTSVQNVITGLNRRPDADKFKDTKIGILPMGKTNKIWKNFSSGREDTWEIPYGRSMRITEAAKTIIDGHTKKANGLGKTHSTLIYWKSDFIFSTDN